MMRDEHFSSVLKTKMSQEIAEKAGDMEAQAKLLKLASLALGRQVHSGCMLPADVDSCSWQEAIKFCHEASSRLQEFDDGLESSATHPSSAMTPDTSTPHSLTFGSLASWSHGNQCGVCNCLLGKRHLRPRHHCRICGKSVCNSCSPNVVQVNGYRKAQRACTGCLHDVQNSHFLQQRMLQLSKHLDALAGAHPVNPKQFSTLADTVELCERALLSLVVARK